MTGQADARRPRRAAKETPKSGAKAATAKASVAKAVVAKVKATRRVGANPLVVAIGREKNPARRFLRILGPGFITGASDDDPSGIATYASVGAAWGFGILWTALVTYPLMATVQFICAKIGMVTGKGLAGVLRHYYPRWLLYPVVIALFVANTINVGADLGAIAAAVNLLVPQAPPTALVIPIGLGILALQVFASYSTISRIFQWLALVLLAYVGAAILAKPDLGQLIQGTFIPHFSFEQRFLTALVAILGTTISPYLFFWQASHEVEAELSVGRQRLWQRKGATDKELGYAALDVNAGMVFSNVVMYVVMLATAATLWTAGQRDIGSAAQAAEALRPIAGDFSYDLLAIGLIGGGVLAVPVLSGSAAYAMSEAFGWKFGLDRSFTRARQFYVVIGVATVVGIAINMLGINPIDALVGTAVINGLVAPPLLFVIMRIANDKRIMGGRTNGRFANVVGWIAVAVMGIAAILLLVTGLIT